MRRLCLFYKIFCIKVPKYIHSLITSIRTSARQPNEFDSFSCRCEYFQNSFLPNVIMECSKLDLNKLCCLSWSSFCKAQLNIIRPSENKIFNIYDRVDIKFFTGMRLTFGHLREHKLWHNYDDTLIHCALAVLRLKQCCAFFTVPVFQWYLGVSHEWLNEHWQVSPIIESRQTNQCSTIWKSCFWEQDKS